MECGVAGGVGELLNRNKGKNKELYTCERCNHVRRIVLELAESIKTGNEQFR